MLPVHQHTAAIVLAVISSTAHNCNSPCCYFISTQWQLVLAVQFSSRWYLCARKSPYAPHPVSEVSPTSPLKWFQCSYDWRWPSLVLQGRVLVFLIHICICCEYDISTHLQYPRCCRDRVHLVYQSGLRPHGQHTLAVCCNCPGVRTACTLQSLLEPAVCADWYGSCTFTSVSGLDGRTVLMQ